MSTSQRQILTFGCRLNIHESEAIRAAAQAAPDDLVVVNSCAVTAEAGRQVRQAIRRLKREQPSARIVVTGCGVHVEKAHYEAMPDVAYVLGNREKLDPHSWATIEARPKVQVADLHAGSGPALSPGGFPSLDGFSGRSRAFVQVQNGCDHRCTFCVIPLGRGPSRSVPAMDVVRQVRRLVEAGYREVVLTGVDLTSYGLDGGGQPRLGGLVRRILAEVTELPRLRLSSIDSIEADPDLVRAMAEEERLMPHLHLSLQSGDGMILKRMKRRHGPQDAIAFCDDMRRLRPEIAFGADLIAGFPTETEAMFQNSLDMVTRLDLVHLHVFPYSIRPHTPAARMPQVPGEEIRDRARRLREKGAERLNAHLASEVGRVRRVLMERGGKGRTEQFLPLCPAGEAGPGAILRCKVTGVEAGCLKAEVLGPAC